MAKPTVTISDVDELEKSVKDLTSLSQSLRDVFTKINRETDVLGQGFRNIVDTARTNANLAERYLTSQRLQEAVQSRINEIKSKSSFLDSVGLAFKKEETQLQMRIAAAQIRALQSQIAIQGINNRERLRAIEALRIQNVLRGAELRYVTTSANNQSQVVNRLNAQLTAIQSFTPTLQRNNTILGTFKEIGKDIASNMGDFGKYLSGTLPTWKDIVVKGVKMFMEFDKAGFTLRKSFGLLRGDFDVLEQNVKTLAIDLADLGVTFDGVVLATTAIGKEFNTLVAANKDLVKDVSVLSVQLGIAETESAKFLKSISGMSRSTAASQKGMIGFAKAMSNAAGVPLDAVMKDVADASDEIRIYTGSSVVNLIKGAAEARQMGTTFQKMADTAKKLLDFNTSITDEIEASVLLGTNVTFQRARELAYKKDILGANKEILKIAKGMDFDAMDPFQAEAFAKASGKTVTELQEMIQADKEINYIRMNGTVEQKKQLNLMDELKKKRENEAKDIGKQAELKLRQQANQERINQLQNKFNKFMMELAKPVMDVVEPLLDLSIKVLPGLIAGIKIMAGYFALIGSIPFIKSLPVLISYITSIGPAFMAGFKSVGGLIQGGKNMMMIFRGISATFTTIFGVFGKFLGPIGVIINLFTFIGSLMKRWEETPKGFLGALEAIGGALYDTLLKPFKDAYDWIKSIFVGNSPSKLSMGMYNGIVSIGPSLSDAITEPFKTGYDNISKLSSNAKPPIFNGVNNGVNNGVGTNIPTDTTNSISAFKGIPQLISSLNSIPTFKGVTQLTLPETAIDTTNVTSTLPPTPNMPVTTNAPNTNPTSMIDAVRQGIKEGMNNISLNVYLDGQKMVTGLSKNVGFRQDTGGIAMQPSLT